MCWAHEHVSWLHLLLENTYAKNGPKDDAFLFSLADGGNLSPSSAQRMLSEND